MDNLDEEKTFKKDRNCRRCELIFDCKGKPQGVELCIRFKERKSNIERD